MSFSLSDAFHDYISVPKARFIYDAARKYFVLGSAVLFGVTFVVNADFGRFSGGKGQGGKSWMYVNGKVSWFFMEIVSPICCTLTFLAEPLAMPNFMPIPLYPAQKILFALFLIHYTNRAILSPLRTPSRSKAHISVPLAGVVFNVLNGSLIGSYLSSPQARIWLAGKEKEWWWWAAFGVWLFGFVGNIVHDEILLNLRRKTKGQSDKKNDDAPKDGKPKEEGQHYAIPHGLLFEYITFPNYFCEWVEWTGFAVAASAVPFSFASVASLISPASIIQLPSLIPAIPEILLNLLVTPPMFFFRYLTPPWIFLLNEIVLMFPRAYKGHLWYKEKFGDAYPKNRKIAFPGLL